MSIREFVDSLKSNKQTELKSLYKKPMPETRDDMPVSQVFKKNIFHQADVLYLPEDKNFKYLLVVVDLYDRSVDAEPLKDILSKENDVLQGFKKIYSRKYLKLPKIITLDRGSEFVQSSIYDYFKKNKVNVKYALSGRSRQLANVERMNQKIGTILLKRQASQELLTGEVSKEWVDDIKPLIKLLNERKKTPLNSEISPDIQISDYSKDLFPIGTKVRLKLDKPIDTVKGNRLHGNFRSADIKWTTKVYKITQVFLKPSSPPLYLTDADDNIGRTKQQLQKVSGNETEPDPKFNRGNNEYGIVAQILDKQIVNRKTEYLCRFKGDKAENAIWLSAKELDRTKDLKEIKREYNENN
jgi:hypothetical protein